MKYVKIIVIILIAVLIAAVIFSRFGAKLRIEDLDVPLEEGNSSE